MKLSELLQHMDQEEFSLEALRSAVKDRGARLSPRGYFRFTGWPNLKELN